MAVQPYMGWIPIKKKRKTQYNVFDNMALPTLWMMAQMLENQTGKTTVVEWHEDMIV